MRGIIIATLVAAGCHASRSGSAEPASRQPAGASSPSADAHAGASTAGDGREVAEAPPQVADSEPAPRRDPESSIASHEPRKPGDPTSERMAELIDRFEQGGTVVWLQEWEGNKSCVAFDLAPPTGGDYRGTMTQEWVEREPGPNPGDVCTRVFRSRFLTTAGGVGMGADRRPGVTLMGPHSELVEQKGQCAGGAGGMSFGCAEDLALEDGPHGSVLAGVYPWFLDMKSCAAALDPMKVPSGGGC